MKLRIESDGTGNGTTIVNEETGEPIENATCVEWKVQAGGTATATITMTQVKVNVIGTRRD